MNLNKMFGLIMALAFSNTAMSCGCCGGNNVVVVDAFSPSQQPATTRTSSTHTPRQEGNNSTLAGNHSLSPNPSPTPSRRPSLAPHRHSISSQNQTSDYLPQTQSPQMQQSSSRDSSTERSPPYSAQAATNAHNTPKREEEGGHTPPPLFDLNVSRNPLSTNQLEAMGEGWLAHAGSPTTID